MSEAIHCAIHHDPQERCVDLLTRHGAEVRGLFNGGFVSVTPVTLEKTGYRQLLEDCGLNVLEGKGQGHRLIDDQYNTALAACANRGPLSVIFCGCLDRTLHWVDRYPEELGQVLARGTESKDYVMLGRTRRAWETHPIAQLQPEAYTNRVTAKYLDMPRTRIDVATGARIMTNGAARKILEWININRGKLDGIGVDIDDALWPLAARQSGLVVGCTRVEGLEYETPDQFTKEIAKIGYEEWVRKMYDDVNIRVRWNRAWQSERALRQLTASFEAR